MLPGLVGFEHEDLEKGLAPAHWPAPPPAASQAVGQVLCVPESHFPAHPAELPLLLRPVMDNGQRGPHWTQCRRSREG